MNTDVPIIKGVQDCLYYVISDDCICCGVCESACPTGAISLGDAHYEIDPSKCIDCGTCAMECPMGVPQPV